MKNFEELLKYLSTRKEKIYDQIVYNVPILLVLLIVVFFLKIFNIPLIQQVYNNTWTLLISTWNKSDYIFSWVENIVVEQLSGNNQTGDIILTWNIIPKEPRAYIEYKLNNWTPWKDFFVINPEPQPIIHWDTKDENNKILFPYVYKYRYRISMPKNTWWYIMITLNKVLKKDRDIFIALNWYSKWALNKNLSEVVHDEKEFLYDIEKIPAWWYNINLFNYIVNWYLEIWWFVSEVWNWIEKITIVFK